MIGTQLILKLSGYCQQSGQYANCFRTLVELFSLFQVHHPSKLKVVHAHQSEHPSFNEIHRIFENLRKFSDLIISLELEEAEKFYRLYKPDFGHHLFVSYVSAFTSKLRNQNSSFSSESKR